MCVGVFMLCIYACICVNVRVYLVLDCRRPLGLLIPFHLSFFLYLSLSLSLSLFRMQNVSSQIGVNKARMQNVASRIRVKKAWILFWAISPHEFPFLESGIQAAGPRRFPWSHFSASDVVSPTLKTALILFWWAVDSPTSETPVPLWEGECPPLYLYRSPLFLPHLSPFFL